MQKNRVIPLAIEDVKIILPVKFKDERGYFTETFRSDWTKEIGLTCNFIQDNESLSIFAGTIRGMHFQLPPFAQDKLIRVVKGEIFDVAVDVRPGSITFGKWVSTVLSQENGHQLYIPQGFLHGFMTLVPHTIVNYKVSAYYSKEHDRGVVWNDPQVKIEWPKIGDTIILSEKDRNLPLLKECVSCLV